MRLLGKTICITGGTGYLASHLINRLSEFNNIHVITRNKEQFLSNCYPHFYHTTNIHVFESDYSDSESILTALIGCDILVHCASPVILSSFGDADSDEKKIVQPAIEVTKSILHLIEKTTIELVLFTSSTSAVYSPNKYCMDESDWPAGLIQDPYSRSKILAEKCAWEISRNKKWTLLVMLPGRIIGPPIYKKIPESFISILEILNEKKNIVTNYHSSFCDVRDVAEIYEDFMNKPPKSGRYIISFATVSLKDYYEALQPLAKLPPLHFIDVDDNFIFDMKSTLHHTSIMNIPFKKSINDSWQIIEDSYRDERI